MTYNNSLIICHYKHNTFPYRMTITDSAKIPELENEVLFRIDNLDFSINRLYSKTNQILENLMKDQKQEVKDKLNEKLTLEYLTSN